MLAVLRLINDAFLEQVVLPLFERGRKPVSQALGSLDLRTEDADVTLLAHRLRTEAPDLPLFEARSQGWVELAQRLLFHDWQLEGGRWKAYGEVVVYGGAWDDTLEMALMLEMARYPYWDKAAALEQKQDFIAAPRADLGMASFFRGVWDSSPGFVPNEVLGENALTLSEEESSLTAGVWSYRTARVVRNWGLQLSAKLSRLLWRESERIKPVELFEAPVLLDYWRGRKDAPPALTVAFTALGPQASAWVTQFGQICRAVDEATRVERGLLLKVTPVRLESPTTR